MPELHKMTPYLGLLQDRVPAPAPAADDTLGRNLFEVFRRTASGAMLGASVFEQTRGDPR